MKKEANIKNDASYEACVKEWRFRKKQLEEIKNSKLLVAANENTYRDIQYLYNCACLKLIGYRF
jgi:hypothetical protein